ncbi:MAG: cyclic nucleotide-binding domain-containing protein [Planctomycetes bacterium]|nr:cyclic nucleotide-binding domain-containing protein [Planctomycetota bacterium]
MGDLVRLKIDGQEIAVPATKEAYDPLFKKHVTIPTTIYDAAVALAQKSGQPNPIPILCHREHINPVAVCRVCSVEVKMGGVPGRVLAPACYRPVENKMEVETAQTNERVKTTVRCVTQLLLSDHPSGEMPSHEGDNELDVIARRYDIHGSPYPRAKEKRAHDNSSVVIAVDHNACILCDRCIRACNEIRDNQVLGRMGKGYKAQIAFDLNNPMGDSTCVACGECAVSCPTGALLHRKEVEADPWQNVSPRPGPVRADELSGHPLFEGVSVPFLRWNEGSVVRRQFKKGDVICREGEFGSTAFLIEKGKVKVFLQSPRAHVQSRDGWKGLFGLIQKFTSGLVSRSRNGQKDEKQPRYIHIDAPVALELNNPIAMMSEGDIFGEMTCMNHYPRSATVVADEDCTVLEMLRNVLYILQRNKKSRAWLDQRYRDRSINNHLRGVPLFADVLEDEEEFQRFVNYLRLRVELRRLTPGEVLFRQDDPADNFYMVRVGFIKVSQRRPGGEQILRYIGPGGYFGEIGILSRLPELAGKVPAGVRTATCAALDHVDLVVVKPGVFVALNEHFPKLRQHFLSIAEEHLRRDQENKADVDGVALGDFLQQGLMNAQSLLVLDLEKCTRCDECTKACADSHDGVTRLIREGLRFDKWLVASSCRSCLDPYCMVGCPVGSIRRKDSREIHIEDWCIGCGKCAQNCPYGNINMHGFDETISDPLNPGRKIAVVQQKATVCDLCESLDGQPSCVYACPHDAAHRMAGKELMEQVGAHN